MGALKKNKIFSALFLKNAFGRNSPNIKITKVPINVSNIKSAGPRYQSNGWSSLCVSYSVQKWSFATWAGANYYINGKQPDFRLGFTITYTIKKW